MKPFATIAMATALGLALTTFSRDGHAGGTRVVVAGKESDPIAARLQKELVAMGFSDDVMHALRLVTHAKSTPYADYVVAAKANPIARQVKLSDLRDNARLDRTLLRPGSVERDMRRIQRYVLSYKILTDQIDEAAYRDLMKGAEA